MTGHECYALGCAELVPWSRLMCAYHWRKVSRPLQRAVWAAYRRRREPGGALEHAAACRAAQRYVQMAEQLERDRADELEARALERDMGRAVRELEG